MGRLAGIARHSRSRGPVEELECVRVTRAEGVEGNCRGRAVDGRQPARQVSLLAAESWHAALAELGTGDTPLLAGLVLGDAPLRWSLRRANLLIEGVDLPRQAGRVIAIGRSLRIEVTMECDPCYRMDDVRPGLKAALAPNWRGGVLGRVLADGEIAVGDEVRIEQ